MPAKAQRKPSKTKSARRRPAKKAKPAAPPAVQGSHSSYESALLKSIMRAHASYRVSRYALALSELLANSTPSMRELSYKHGISAGRSLYRLCEQDKHYSLYEEGVGDLVTFFENAGLGRISYNAFPGMVSIIMHDNQRMPLGAGMHTFESGIIAGFLTAARRQLVHVTEGACAGNGSDACEFRSSPIAEAQDLPGDARRAFDVFVSGAATEAAMPEHNLSVAGEYLALSSLVLLDPEYAHEVRILADHLGGMFADELSATPRRAIHEAVRTVSLLSLGASKVAPIGADGIELWFSGPHSRKEFANLALSFVDGLVRRATKGGAIAVKCLADKDAYKIRIARKAQAAKRKPRHR